MITLNQTCLFVILRDFGYYWHHQKLDYFYHHQKLDYFYHHQKLDYFYQNFMKMDLID